jgi:tail tube protein gp19
MTNKRHELQGASGIFAARRQFLRQTSCAGLLALGGPALAVSWASAAHGATRAYAAGLYGLELDGVFAGLVTGFGGGNVTADVIKEQAGQDLVQHKHPGAARVEPITIEAGLPMAKPLYDWIKSSVEPHAKFPRKNGAIIEFGAAMKEMGRRNFSNALVTGVEFPGCDAASKEQASLAVTFSPETLRLSAPKGGTIPPQPLKKAPWPRSNFRLRIQGLEAATARTAKIEPIDIKVTRPGAIEVPNLAITVSDASVGLFYTWLDDFVVKGNNAQDRERTGVLEYLSPNMASVLLAVNLFNLGILKVSPEPAGADAVRRSRVEMYCEAVTADFKI